MATAAHARPPGLREGKGAKGASDSTYDCRMRIGRRRGASSRVEQGWLSPVNRRSCSGRSRPCKHVFEPLQLSHGDKFPHLRQAQMPARNSLPVSRIVSASPHRLPTPLPKLDRSAAVCTHNQGVRNCVRDYETADATPVCLGVVQVLVVK